jgi:hypothetical protein
VNTRSRWTFIASRRGLGIAQAQPVGDGGVLVQDDFKVADHRIGQQAHSIELSLCAVDDTPNVRGSAMLADDGVERLI